MFDRHRLDNRHLVPIDDEIDGLEATLRKPGALPRVMFVEPNFTDIPPLKTANDDLAPTDLKHGQAFISRICDLIWDGAVSVTCCWSSHTMSTAVFTIT